jgi:hypothetical protein
MIYFGYPLDIHGWKTKPETEPDTKPETENRGWKIISKPEPVGIQPEPDPLPSLVLGRGHSLLQRRRSGSAAALSDGGARAPPRSASPSLTPSSSTSSLVKNDTSYTQLDAPYLTACSAPSPAAAGNAPFPSDGFVPLGCVCTCSLANVLVGSEF